MLLICNIETPTRKHVKQQRKLVERNVTFLQVILQSELLEPSSPPAHNSSLLSLLRSFELSACGELDTNEVNRVIRQRTTRVYVNQSSYPHADNSIPMKLTELSACGQLGILRTTRAHNSGYTSPVATDVFFIVLRVYVFI